MTKKKNDSQNSNINTNNINVNVNVEPSSQSAKEEKPNWFIRAIIVGIIGTTLSIGGFYIKKANEKNKMPIIESSTSGVIGNKAK